MSMSENVTVQKPVLKALDIAVELADRGLPLIPLKPWDPSLPATDKSNGKRPMEEDWRNKATTDEAVVRSWPWPCNTGIVPDGTFIVLDIENKDGKDGLSDLELLEMLYGPLPLTFTVKTTTGGEHRYLKTPYPLRHCKAGIIAPGIEVIANTQVVAPGSTINRKRYKVVVDAPVADAPVWLLDLVGKPEDRKLTTPSSPIAEAVLAEAMSHIPAGCSRADYLMTVAGCRAAAISGDRDGGRAKALVLRWARGELDRANKYRDASPSNYVSDADVLKDFYSMEPKGGGIGLGSLIALAQKNEWEGNPFDSGIKPAETFAKAELPVDNPKDHKPTHNEVTLVPFSQIEEERIAWLWRGRFAVGKLNLIAGTPGDGKTTIAIDLAARQSNGGDLPFMEGKLEQSLAIILSAEDDASDTLKPRLRAAGANMEYVLHMASEVNRNTKTGVEHGVFNFVDDMRRVETQIIALREQGRTVKSFIIDPISSFMGGRGKGDMWKNADTRYILTYLTDFARRQRVAIIGITHLNKSADTRALYRVIDSIGMVGAARGVWITAKELDEDGNPTGRTIFALGKTNIAKPPSSLAYRIEGVSMPAADGGAPIETSRINWEAIVALTADQALSRAGKGNSEDSKTSKAVAFLEQVLADGSLDVNEIKRKARKQKQGWRTVERAKAALNVEAKRTGGVGANGKWEWSLPDDADEDADFALLFGEAGTEHQPMSAFGGKADIA